MASVNTPSANESVKDLILVYIVQLKYVIKVQLSARMVSNGISDVQIASVHSDKTSLKNCACECLCTAYLLEMGEVMA